MTGVKSRQDKGFIAAGHVVMIVLSLLTLAPFILLVSGSLTENSTAIKYGYSFWPRVFSLDAYKYIANSWGLIGRAYLMTIIVTVVGTGLSILVTTMFAYALSDSELIGGRILNRCV